MINFSENGLSLCFFVITTLKFHFFPPSFPTVAVSAYEYSTHILNLATTYTTKTIAPASFSLSIRRLPTGSHEEHRQIYIYFFTGIPTLLSKKIKI
jgi:hypothetical protein